MPEHYAGPYRAFTTAHDLEVEFTTSEALSALVSASLQRADPDFPAMLNESLPLYEPFAQRLVEYLRPHDLHNVHITLLLDHSGSLRGTPSCVLAALTGIYSECLTRLDIGHEVLAFTTRSWKGGASKRSWHAAGKPSAPGRVCDLLHIIYRKSESTEPISYAALEQMTRSWLIKENVDGEAVQWATARLRRRPQTRKILLVISDGAPVDDTTLFLNGPNILDDHLRETNATLVREGDIEIYGLGIGYAMWRYYPQYFFVRDAHDIGPVALPILMAILATNAHAPTPEQAATINKRA